MIVFTAAAVVVNVVVIATAAVVALILQKLVAAKICADLRASLGQKLEWRLPGFVLLKQKLGINNLLKIE